MRSSLASLVVVLAVASTLPAPALGDPPAGPFHGRLPQPAFALSAVWTGSAAYLFGGADMICYCELDWILRYDPASGSLEPMPARLPVPWMGSTAVWDGQSAHVFLGSHVARYQPGTGDISTRSLGDYYPGNAAVWNGTHAFLFTLWERALRYDPATGEAVLMPTKAPMDFYGTSAVWDGRHAYLFGHSPAGNGRGDLILRYDPATDSYSAMQARLPTPRGHMVALWDGAAAWLFGGLSAVEAETRVASQDTGYHWLPEVLRYDPAADRIESVGLLPLAIGDTAGVWVDGAAHLFGGECTCPPTAAPALSPEPFAVTHDALSRTMETDLVQRFATP